jgi:hypothetical protein
MVQSSTIGRQRSCAAVAGWFALQIAEVCAEGSTNYTAPARNQTSPVARSRRLAERRDVRMMRGSDDLNKKKNLSD